LAVIWAIGLACSQVAVRPVGADIDGSVSGPINIRLGAPVFAARNIGPVSLPITNAALRNNCVSVTKLVFPHRSTASPATAVRPLGDQVEMTGFIPIDAVRDW